MKHHYLMLPSLIISCGFSTVQHCYSQTNKKKPNIIVLMTDDQTYHSIHAISNSAVRTPNMDKLVKNGVTFTNHYATTAISMASRACLMTGMYEYKTGCNFMHGPLSPEKFEKSYPVLLREAGYYTGFAGKLGFAVTTNEDLAPRFMNKDQYLPIDKFDSWAGQGHAINYKTKANTYLKKYADKYPHLTLAIGAYGKDFIEQAAKKDKPFCMTVFFKAPHGPLIPDPVYDDIYAGRTFQNPINFGREEGKKLPMQAKIGRQYLSYFNLHKNKYNEYNRKVNQLIYGVDVVIGQYMDKLKELGLDKNTIIIFTSDNGYSHGSHALGGKLLPFEEGAKVPLIIYDPNNIINAGTRTRSLAANVDITSTILDYADVPAPKNIDGVSLRPVLDNPTKEVRKSLPSINDWGNPQACALTINTKNWKYTYWGFGEGMTPTETLYNKDFDPLEFHNLANNPLYKKELAHMRKLYDKQITQWKKECVSTGQYENYAILFNRHFTWEKRKQAIPEISWDYYDNLLKQIKYKGNKFDYKAVIQHAEDQ